MQDACAFSQSVSVMMSYAIAGSIQASFQLVLICPISYSMLILAGHHTSPLLNPCTWRPCIFFHSFLGAILNETQTMLHSVFTKILTSFSWNMPLTVIALALALSMSVNFVSVPFSRMKAAFSIGLSLELRGAGTHTPTSSRTRWLEKTDNVFAFLLCPSLDSSPCIVEYSESSLLLKATPFYILEGLAVQVAVLDVKAKLQYFMQGLQTNLHIKVAVVMTQTITQAQQIARAINAVLERKKQLAPHTSDPMDTFEAQRVEHCYWCGIPGHIEANYRNKANEQPRKAQIGQQSKQRKLVCFKCGKPEHI
jgi:hypothetical protein